MKNCILTIILFLSTLSSFSQYSQLQLGDTAKVEYPYNFPILGAKAFENGFDIPFPIGGMLNFFTASQDILIPEISIGFNESELYDITNIIEFSEISATATSINFRPDLWVLPFLNVYGVFGKTYAQTTVELSFPIQLKTVAELEGTSVGFGTTGAGGLGKYFFVLDGNWVWTTMTNFEEPVGTSTFSFRIGRAFKIAKHPDSNLAGWIGGMRIKMGGITEGSILMGDVIPDESWARRDEIVGNYWEWYDNIKAWEVVKKEVADKVFTPIVDQVDASDGSGRIKYRLRKEPKQKWNMIIGGQYQFNKHHQFRAEGGIVGNRKSLLLSYNYRFGFKKKMN